jgi:acyl-CoA reductase-like NAD-dependent aldehyde dehydrogenase
VQSCLQPSPAPPDAARLLDNAVQARAPAAHNGFRSDFSIAFGGFKQSGIGREGGVEGLHAYLETKTMIFDKKE